MTDSLQSGTKPSSKIMFFFNRRCVRTFKSFATLSPFLRRGGLVLGSLTFLYLLEDVAVDIA